MWQNTKLLIAVSLLIFFSGVGFLWFGLQPVQQVIIPTPLPLVKTTSPSATPSSDSRQVPLIASSSAVVGIDGERVYVTKVVDGDTFEIEGGIVRFIGIDTPETVDPRRPVGCFGKEASNETKSLLNGKMVILQRDISDKDKYGRLLRYVFLPLDDGRTLFVDDYLVREGFAKVYTYPPDVKYNEQLREAENEARENNRGLWGVC